MTAFDHPNKWTTGKTAEQLIDFLGNGGAEPGSVVHEAVVAALQLRIADRQNQNAEKQLQIAEAQRDAALASAAWTKAQGIATTVATVIALAALLIAAL